MRLLEISAKTRCLFYRMCRDLSGQNGECGVKRTNGVRFRHKKGFWWIVR